MFKIRDTVGLHIAAWPCGVVSNFAGNYDGMEFCSSCRWSPCIENRTLSHLAHGYCIPLCLISTCNLICCFVLAWFSHSSHLNVSQMLDSNMPSTTMFTSNMKFTLITSKTSSTSSCRTLRVWEHQASSCSSCWLPWWHTSRDSWGHRRVSLWWHVNRY